MKIMLLAVFLECSIPALSQNDTLLTNRINAMLRHTKAKDIDKLMDYTYPRLFSIVPREMMAETMKEMYDTDEFTIELDSLDIDTIYAVFTINDTSYVKVKHTLLMRMRYKEPYDTADAERKFSCYIDGIKIW